jgi:hypothetical protein
MNVSSDSEYSDDDDEYYKKKTIEEEKEEEEEKGKEIENDFEILPFDIATIPGEELRKRNHSYRNNRKDLLGLGAPNIDRIEKERKKREYEEKKKKRKEDIKRIILYAITLPVVFCDKVWAYVWFKCLCFFEYFLLLITPKKTKHNNRYAHLFMSPSPEEGGSYPYKMYGRNSHFIRVVENTRRHLMMEESKRHKIWKIVYSITIISFILYYSAIFTAKSMEHSAYVTPEFMDAKSGHVIKNYMHSLPLELSSDFKEEHEWLLYKRMEKEEEEGAEGEQNHRKKREILDKDKILSDYVEVDTMKFGKVNISISNLIKQMKRDHVEKSSTIDQPCICGVHYGLPINIIFFRDDVSGSDYRVCIEPVITSKSYTNIKAVYSIDSLVVPKRMYSYQKTNPLDSTHPRLDILIKSSSSTFPLVAHGELDYIIENIIPNARDFTDIEMPEIVDLKPVIKWFSKRNSPELIYQLKEIKEKIDSNIEISFGYNEIRLKSYREDGSEYYGMPIKAPFSICAQRCLAALNER